MNLHLAAISKQIAAGGHAVVIVDGAGWHIADALSVPDNISLLFLPPYSPELNAQENIWQYLRQNFLAVRIFDTYTDIVDACCNAWKALTEETGRIQSIASRDWLSWIGSYGRWYKTIQPLLEKSTDGTINPTELLIHLSDHAD